MAGRLDARFGSGLHERVVGEALGADEPAREVGVDRAGGVHGGLAAVDRPCADLVGAHGEEADQPERLVGERREAAARALRDAHVGHEVRRLVFVELGELHLEVAGELDRGEIGPDLLHGII